MTPHKRPKATPYGRPSTTKNLLDGDGAGGRPVVFDHSPAWSSGPKAQPEFSGLAFFWFLFWGNAKKGTKTRSNKQKIKTSSTKRSKATYSLRYFYFLSLPLFLSLSFGAQKKVTTPLVHRTKLTRAYASVPKIALHSVAQNKLALSFLQLSVFCDCLAAHLCLDFSGRAQTVFCAATPFQPMSYPSRLQAV